jgi:hypothetical protein
MLHSLALNEGVDCNAILIPYLAKLLQLFVFGTCVSRKVVKVPLLSVLHSWPY